MSGTPRRGAKPPPPPAPTSKRGRGGARKGIRADSIAPVLQLEEPVTGYTELAPPPRREPGEEALSPSSFEPLSELPPDDAETGQLNFDEEPPTQVAIPSTQVSIPAAARVDLDSFDFDPDPVPPPASNLSRTEPPKRGPGKAILIGVAVVLATGLGAFGAHTIVEHLRAKDAAAESRAAAVASAESAAPSEAELSGAEPAAAVAEPGKPELAPQPSANDDPPPPEEAKADEPPTDEPNPAEPAVPAAAPEPTPDEPKDPPAAEEPEVAVDDAPPTPPPVAPPPTPVGAGPHAELLSQAQEAFANGKTNTSYKLAKESFDAKPTKAALLLMVRSNCSMGLSTQAIADYRKLSLSSRKAIREECKALGVDLGS